MTLDPHRSALARIRASWEGYRALLPGNERRELDRLMDSLERYAGAIEVKARPFENDPMFMSWKLDDEKRIRWIIEMLLKLEKERKA